MTLRMSLLAAAVSLLTGGAAAAQTPTDLSAGTDAIFKEFASRDSPGCAVGIHRDGRQVLSRAYGMANLDHDVPLSPSTVFHVASVSKQFTAAAILLLEQDGKLSVDDDVRKYVPELPDFGTRITLRHLAHHTSGVRDQWSLLGLAGWRYSRDLITDDDVLWVLSRQRDLNFRPGERHLYSNSGYTLLALVVSRVSGKSFREFTAERIFKPLGMTNTRFRDNFNEIVKGQAYGYARERDTFRLSVTNFDTVGATSLLTTVEDLDKWHAQFAKPAVGGPGLVAKLLERGLLNNGEPIDYGFGISHRTYRGLTAFGHGGADAGYRSTFLQFPEHRFGVSVLCNVVTNPTSLAERVADLYLAEHLQPRTTPVSTDALPELPLPADRLAALAGLYWSGKEATAYRFAVHDGRLHQLGGESRSPLKSLGDGRFVRASAPGPQFAFDADGRRLTVGTPAVSGETFERAEPFEPSAAQLQEFAGVYRSEELDVAWRMTLRDGGLRLERVKAAPALMEPLVTDTYAAPAGVLQFTRDAAGRVAGFLLNAGRVRNVRFSKEARGGS